VTDERITGENTISHTAFMYDATKPLRSLQELAKIEGVEGKGARTVLASLELEKNLKQLNEGECGGHLTTEESIRLGIQIAEQGGH